MAKSEKLCPRISSGPIAVVCRKEYCMLYHPGSKECIEFVTSAGIHKIVEGIDKLFKAMERARAMGI